MCFKKDLYRHSQAMLYPLSHGYGTGYKGRVWGEGCNWKKECSDTDQVTHEFREKVGWRIITSENEVRCSSHHIGILSHVGSILVD